MCRLCMVVGALLLVAGAAAGQDQNLVGLVIEPDCPLLTNQQQNPCFNELNCGTNDIFLVAVNPWNTVLDGPITNLGGFECKLGLPAGIYLLAVSLPPASVNFKPLPELVVGTVLPAVGEQTVLASLTVLVPEYVGDTLFATLSPVHPAYQSIPGRLALSDADDDFSLHAADAYGPGGAAVDFTEPMLYFGDPHGSGAPCVVGNDERTWGSLKALYR